MPEESKFSVSDDDRLFYVLYTFLEHFVIFGGWVGMVVDNNNHRSLQSASILVQFYLKGKENWKTFRIYLKLDV